MANINIILALTITIIITTLTSGNQAALLNNNLVNRNVKRLIDISSQLVRIKTKVIIENVAKTPVSSFTFTLEKDSADKLVFISIKDAAQKDLKTTETASGDPLVKAWLVEPKEPLAPGAKLEYNSLVILAKALVPHPATVRQRERQLVLYDGNHYYLSPYQTDTQRTTVLLASRNLESYSKLKPSSQSDSTIEYGPYDNIAPLSVDKMSVHSENESPFLTVTKIERSIEISHWGNIAVEETIDIYHSGAVLEGPFSRYDFQQDPSGGPSSVKSYKTLLPASASGVYYRDTNGNISTSHMRIKKDAVELDLRPRFPLFGGWKTHYTLGYNVPSYEYLYRSGDQYMLRMRVIDHIHDDMVVDELVTRVILPEGSSNMKLSAPFPVSRQKDSLHATYLDTNGRPTITFSKRNLVESHIQDFRLRYSFPRLLMLQEPLLIVGFLYLLFICVIIYVRLDFSIHKDEHLKE